MASCDEHGELGRLSQSSASFLCVNDLPGMAENPAGRSSGKKMIRTQVEVDNLCVDLPSVFARSMKDNIFAARLGANHLRSGCPSIQQGCRSVKIARWIRTIPAATSARILFPCAAPAKHRSWHWIRGKEPAGWWKYFPRCDASETRSSRESGEPDAPVRRSDPLPPG